MRVLHLAPHPDDEAVGAPATLLGLVAAGHEVVNLACSLGREGDHARREAEVTEACARAGFALEIVRPPPAISGEDDRDAAQAALTEAIAARLDGVDLVVGPSPHDGHHGHEVVGRAARDAVAGVERPVRLWLWGLWADLPVPTLFVAFDEARLERALHVLAAHAGELARTDLVALVRARGTASRVLGAERVFGTGAPGRPGPYAELLCEVEHAAGEWWAGAPREPDLAAPLAPVPRNRPLGWWLGQRSFGDRLADLSLPYESERPEPT